jgi:oligosaccharide 4-alpha-D-glucosyltransferase
MPSRKVVLPKGKWFNFWNNEPHNGESNVFENLTLDNIPVFARAGSVIPMASSAKSSTDFYTSDSLTVKFFQDISVASATFTMFHDDGADPNSLQNQRFELIDFTGKTWKDSVQLDLNRRKTFDGNITNRSLLVEFENITSLPKSVKLNNSNVPLVFQESAFKADNLAYYDVSTKQLKVRFQWNCATPAKLLVFREGLSILTANEELVAESQLKIYPNPSQSHSQVTIEAQITESGNYQLAIFNAAGAAVYDHSFGKFTIGSNIKHSWNTGDLSGIFFVKLRHENGKVITRKIVIE